MFIILVSIFFGLNISCSPLKTISYKDIHSKYINSYEIIELPNFDKTSEVWVPYYSYTIIPDMVAESLISENPNSVILRKTQANPDSGRKVLLVHGKVTNYNRGCKFCEWFIRINDKGKSSVTVRIKLIDKKTGELIADQSIEGRAVKPGYGRSRYIRVRDKIVTLIIEASIISS